MSRFYIGHIEISATMGQKISSMHGVTPDEVREACQAPSRYARASWHDHPEHGRRIIVIGTTKAGRVLKVILQPVDVAE